MSPRRLSALFGVNPIMGREMWSQDFSWTNRNLLKAYWQLSLLVWWIVVFHIGVRGGSQDNPNYLHAREELCIDRKPEERALPQLMIALSWRPFLILYSWYTAGPGLMSVFFWYLEKSDRTRSITFLPPFFINPIWIESCKCCETHTRIMVSEKYNNERLVRITRIVNRICTHYQLLVCTSCWCSQIGT